MSTSTIVRIEAGEVKPHPRTLAALVAVLNARSTAMGHNDDAPAVNGRAGKPGDGDSQGTAY